MTDTVSIEDVLEYCNYNEVVTLGASLFVVDTGAELACTEATNVITIGGAVTTVPLAIMASGW